MNTFFAFVMVEINKIKNLWFSIGIMLHTLSETENRKKPAQGFGMIGKTPEE